MALSARGWLTVQWDKINDSVVSLANSTSTVGNSTFGGIGAPDIVHNITTSLGLPATGGLAAGFAIGFMRG